MTPSRASLLLLTAVGPLAVAACQTVRKPIRGFDKVPPGSIALEDDNGGTLMMWPMFDVPQAETPEIFRPRLNGQDIVYQTSPQDDFYDYYTWQMQGWTGGWNTWFQWMKPDTYVVEIVDSTGQSWGKSAPIAVAGGSTAFNPSGQLPAVIFAHFDGTVASWNIDPTTQDADTATDQITVTNLAASDAVVERCLISSGHASDCTSVGTVAAGAEMLTVETLAAVDAKDDHQALVIHLASDGSLSYQRDLVQGTGNLNFGSTCQIERIIVHAARQAGFYSASTVRSEIAMSSCYGYSGGPPSQ